MRKNVDKQSIVSFGKRIKDLREAANVSQEQIQYATGISQMHVSRLQRRALDKLRTAARSDSNDSEYMS